MRYIKMMLLFIFNSILLGVGLAMDAFSISLANGLHEPDMTGTRMSKIAGVYAGFQFFMPMAGWLCVHTIVTVFQSFQKFIPWIAMGLLFYIGGSMVVEFFRGGDEEEAAKELGIGTLMLQGIATSIDALSVGFTISDYGLAMAALCAAIIGGVTFVICMVGLKVGSNFGTRLAGKAELIGGIILILIGIEMVVL